MGNRGQLLAAVFSAAILLLIPIAYNLTQDEVNTMPSFSSKTGEANLNAKRALSASSTTSHFTVFDEPCTLPKLDPWDKSIVKYLDPNENPLKHCHRIATQLTWLDNGTLQLNQSHVDIHHYECYFRCLYTKSDVTLEYGEWISFNAGVNPDCDIVEVECKLAGLSAYRYLHTQIYEPPKEAVVRTSRDADGLSTHFNEDIRIRLPRLGTLTPKKMLLRTSTPNSASEDDTEEVMDVADDAVPAVDDHPAAAGEKQWKRQWQPDVLLLIIDSVSTSQVIRSIPKTLHILQNDYEAQVFPHLNKIGLNSRPNGFALLNGLQIDNLPAGVFYDKPIKSEFPHYCKRYLDNGTFIAKAFQQAGYKTMMAEDWAMGVFNWPDCKGFDKQPTDHYMRPFQLRLDGKGFKDEVLKNAMLKYSCREAHEYVMDYLTQFTRAYPGQPKFSISWLSYISHDSASGLYHADDDFATFFTDLKPLLNDAFLIVMADHGLRFGPVRATEIGQIEDNNPFLSIAVPQRLRKNQRLMANLKENSQFLVTHYDTYATMLDIVNIAPKSKFDDFSEFDFRKLDATKIHGTSYLRQFRDPAVRNCATLRIPFSYCTCQFTKTAMETNSTLIQAAGHYMLTELNHRLEEGNVTDICVTLKMRTIVSASMLQVGNATVLQVTIKVKPSNGTFESFLTYRRSTVNSRSSLLEDDKEDFSFHLVTGDITRSNRYGGQSECTKKAPMRPICYCKNLLPQSKRVMRK